MKLKQILESCNILEAFNITDYREKLRQAPDNIKAEYKKYIDGEIADSYISVKDVLEQSSLNKNDPRWKRIVLNAPESPNIENVMIWKSKALDFLKAAIANPDKAFKKMAETRKQIIWNPENISNFWEDLRNRGKLGAA